MSIKVTGVKRTAKAIRESVDAKSVGRALMQGGMLLETSVKAHASGRPGPRAPTGDYRGSWTTTRVGAYAVQVGTDRPQGRALEFGHPRWAPGTMYPHVGPAMKKSEAKAVEVIERELFKRLK